MLSKAIASPLLCRSILRRRRPITVALTYHVINLLLYTLIEWKRVRWLTISHHEIHDNDSSVNVGAKTVHFNYAFFVLIYYQSKF